MKPIFPTIYSTLCPDALANHLSSNYDHGTIKCRFIVRGVGDTYMAETADQKFILRIYRSTHRNLEQIQAETGLLTALHAANVSVSYPVADRNGNMIQEFDAAEGPRYGVLFSFAPGKSVLQFNDRQLQSLGHEMAAFHNVSSAIRLDGQRWAFDLENTLFRPLEMAKDAFADNPDDYLWLQQAAKRVKQKLFDIDTSRFSSGYCQFDFLPKNFHFDENDQVTLFDFDFLGYGWLVNDMMTFWTHLTLDVFFNRLTQETADRYFQVFLEAYREVRAVSEEELEVIPYLSLGFWLFYMGFHTTHDQFYPVVFQPAQLKVRMNVIKQLMDKYWV